MAELIVEIEVVPTPEPGQKSMFGDGGAPSLAAVPAFKPPAAKLSELARRLGRNGFTVRHVGGFSVSASSAEAHFERFFGTRISEIQLPVPLGRDPRTIRAPRQGEAFALPSTDGLDSLIERAYVQHPPLFFSDERPIPPFWADKPRLRVPGDVAQLMRASSIHQRGLTGRGVRVIMPDTGHYHHPYFEAHGYHFRAVAAPDVADPRGDPHGHGTGLCANLFATAPGIDFIGVKMGNPTLAFATAVSLEPDVVTCGWGYHADLPGTAMPNHLRPLHLTILDAVARGIVVCFSAGDGHFAFPASMPEVLAVGGVVVDQEQRYAATRYASGFDSTWFPGRRVPDVCGLCGTPPTADYIVLPVPIGAPLDVGGGWGAFSGTSAASAMVAGVCALLKQANPKLGAAQIRQILERTAQDVTSGQCAQGHVAASGPDRATGHGLVDAQRAVEGLL